MKKNREGRPLKFKSVRTFKEKAKAYFVDCWRKKLDMFGNPIKDKETKEYVWEQFKPYTITGLANSLETSRETLMDYEEKDEYSDTIKGLKDKCHQYAEESLFVGKNPAGAIFNLKNNYGWKDKTEVEQSGKIELEAVKRYSDEELDAIIRNKVKANDERRKRELSVATDGKGSKKSK